MGLFNSYNVSRTGKQADARAIYADWRAVGNDLLWAMDHAPESEDVAEDAP